MLETLSFSLLKDDPLHHFITTRNGGVSQVPFDSLNLGNLAHDKKEDVQENRKRVKEALGCDHLFIGDQQHTNTIGIIKEDNLEDLISSPLPFPKTDGLITNVKGVGLVTLAADCTPILLFDPIQKVIGAIHSGWKGTELKILTKGIEVMINEFGCLPSDIKVCFGPFIKKETYEIGLEVAKLFEEAYPEIIDQVLSKHPDVQKRYLDITACQKYQCKINGILEQNIEFMPINTYTDRRFFSARKASPNQTGRFGGAIVLV
ncbi:peptidoglycan editing factor PgeF [Flammeovirga sp. MY04]|uniref:peptidoglycan editing factor PgeF n=1 Tax=Flammeovirga sp. MY04 TaxID=1191459 RepID=UPI0008063105|nr:peptidoglycan editing factor PgeF [Flammeovirga sp. MY04]ANQ49225.1 peptidoglycan editing factor PgeF [Flammeovirga sp. MY04]